jgi:hypothetical protein
VWVLGVEGEWEHKGKSWEVPVDETVALGRRLPCCASRDQLQLRMNDAIRRHDGDMRRCSSSRDVIVTVTDSHGKEKTNNLGRQKVVSKATLTLTYRFSFQTSMSLCPRLALYATNQFRMLSICKKIICSVTHRLDMQCSGKLVARHSMTLGFMSLEFVW